MVDLPYVSCIWIEDLANSNVFNDVGEVFSELLPFRMKSVYTHSFKNSPATSNHLFIFWFSSERLIEKQK